MAIRLDPKISVISFRPSSPKPMRRRRSSARDFLFGGGQNTFSRVEHTLPPGYNSKEAIQKLAKQPQGSWLGISGEKMRGQVEEVEIDPVKIRQKLIPGYQKAQKNLQFMIGSPKTVIPKMKAILTTLRPGSLIVFNVQGPVSNKDRQTSMRLIAQEVMPALKEHADSIGLVDAITKIPERPRRARA